MIQQSTIPQSTAFDSLVAAYVVVFAGIFIFIWLMMSRQRRLEKKLQTLRDDLRGKS